MTDLNTSLTVEPYTAASQQLLERGEHALLGVSPGNGYFKTERLEALLRWARDSFDAVDVLYVDLHLAELNVSSGDTPRRAGSRASKAIRDTRRRIRRAVEATEEYDSDLRVRPLSDYVELPGYEAVRRHVDQVTRTSEPVQEACEEHVRSIIDAQDSDGSAIEEEAQLNAGLAYLRTELPFLVDTATVLDVPSSLVCYHSFMPVLRGIYESPELQNQTQGHLRVRPLDEAA